MRKGLVTIVLALVACAVCAQAGAGEPEWLGNFRPTTDVAFTGGLTDRHNSMGFTVGSHIALARLGRLRAPIVGLDAGIVGMCDPQGRPKVQGVADSCGNAGLVQLTGGVEFVLMRARRLDNQMRPGPIHHEFSLYVAYGYPILGPLRGEHAINIGLSTRWGKTVYLSD